VRIALVTDTYAPQVNGVTTVTRRIVRTLEERAARPAMVAPRYPGDRPPEPGELRIPSVPFPPYPAIRLSFPLAARIHAFLDTFGPHLVHVVTEGPLGLAGRRYAIRRRLPLVTSYHTDFPGYCRHYGAGALEGAVWRWLLWFHTPARLTHTPGESVRAELVRRGLAHAVVWGRGVDCEWFHDNRDRRRWRRRLEIADDVALVLHVGRLAPEKNIGTLIRSWTAAHEALGGRVRFVVAGEGPLAGLLEARLPWARRLGFLERDDLADLYAAADVCVLPSATETCGLVALEAMASGVAVIAGDAGGFRETVVHGVNGLLAPPENAAAFSAHIVRLAMEREVRRGLAAAARAFAVSRDVRVECDEVVRQYAALIAAASPLTACHPEDTECAA
jgi:glycosyltransferase involved in cell wall biosynthesis